jgi:hypothetical protein
MNNNRPFVKQQTNNSEFVTFDFLPLFDASVDNGDKHSDVFPLMLTLGCSIPKFMAVNLSPVQS